MKQLVDDTLSSFIAHNPKTSAYELNSNLKDKFERILCHLIQI